MNNFSIAVTSNGTLFDVEVDPVDFEATLLDAAFAMRASVIPTPGGMMVIAAGLGLIAPRRRR